MMYKKLIFKRLSKVISPPFHTDIIVKKKNINIEINKALGSSRINLLVFIF